MSIFYSRCLGSVGNCFFGCKYQQTLMATVISIALSQATFAANSKQPPQASPRPHQRLSHSTIIKPYAAESLWGVPLTTSPYLGGRNRFNANDLIINIPSVNEDLRILQYRQDLHELMHREKLAPPPLPHVKVSGKLEGSLSSIGGFMGSRTSDINLSGAELDFMIDVTRKLVGYTAFKYDSSPFPATVRTARASHSRIFLDKGFFSYGDLLNCPIYLTMGQFYVPFGRFASSMESAPLPMTIGRIKARALLVGYAQQDGDGFQGSVYLYRGDTMVGGNSRIHDGGTNVDYVYAGTAAHGKFGVSVTSNMAEAEGLQISAGTFPGFSSSAAFQTLVQRVPAIDFHALASFNHFSFIGEYVRALRQFNAADLSYLARGAKPRAVNLEASYSMTNFKHPSSVAVGFGHSSETSALGVPKNRVAMSLNTSYYHDTVQTLEFNHAVNYPTSVSMGSNNSAYPVMGGHSSNSVIAKFGVYF